TVALEEALRLELLVFQLVADTGESLARRAVAGELVHTAEQGGHVLELSASPACDARDDEMAQIGVGAAEVEVEFHLAHGLTISRRKDGSRVRRSTHRAAGGRAANTSRPLPPAASAGWGRGCAMLPRLLGL